MPRRKLAAKAKKIVRPAKKTALRATKKTALRATKKTALQGAKKLNKKVAAPRRARKKRVTAIPKGYHSVTPYLIVENAENAINFYKKVFGAKVTKKMTTPNGKIGHSELKIGDSKIMLADECPEMNARSPKAFNGSPVTLHVYVKNVDKVVDKALGEGAKLVKQVDDMFYGDRAGAIEDLFGHVWHVSTHIEDVSTREMKKRVARFYQQRQQELESSAAPALNDS